MTDAAKVCLTQTSFSVMLYSLDVSFSEFFSQP